MPAILIYLLKVSAGLLIVYLFYRLVLRGLTFYTANRWYLLLFSLLCFAVPLIDVTGWIEAEGNTTAIVVQSIPSVHDYISSQTASIATPSKQAAFDIWSVAATVWLAGSMLLLVRIMVGLFSYLRLRNGAKPFTYNSMQLYQLEGPVLPFSFGNAIYLNPQRHTAPEMEEIIRHELVHVRQRHTVDVVWAELLCVFAWFNPFAWLLRHAVRQNLEFIADSKVVQSGANKTAYQYLLLNVMGGVAYPVAHQFNFSAIKQRIVMLNRMPSAKTNAIRFLLVFPLAALLLVACRSNNHFLEPPTGGNEANYFGIIVDATTYKGLPGVIISDSATRAQTETDAQGYFSLRLPLTEPAVASNINLRKEDYGSFTQTKTFTGDAAENRIAFIMKMKSAGADGTTGLATTGKPIEGAAGEVAPTYEMIAAQLPDAISSWKEQERFELARDKTDEVYLVFEGKSYVTSGGGWASVDEITDVIMVDGVQMTGAEVNRKLARRQIESMGAMDRSYAKKNLGVDAALLQITTKPLAKK